MPLGCWRMCRLGCGTGNGVPSSLWPSRPCTICPSSSQSLPLQPDVLTLSYFYSYFLFLFLIPTKVLPPWTLCSLCPLLGKFSLQTLLCLSIHILWVLAWGCPLAGVSFPDTSSRAAGSSSCTHPMARIRNGHVCAFIY